MKPRLSLFVMLLSATAHAAPEPSILNPSGLPVPRFVSLKSAEVNVRVGPGTRATRFAMSISVKRFRWRSLRSFAHWRKIADFEGANGWVHKGMVDGKRTAIITGKLRNLYARPDPESAVVMRAKSRVIGRVLACEPDWCEMDIGGRNGWVRKADIWGVAREEVFKVEALALTRLKAWVLLVNDVQAAFAATARGSFIALFWRISKS